MECHYHITLVLAIGSGFPMHSNCKIPHISYQIKQRLSFMRIHFLNHSSSAISKTNTNTSKTNMPTNLCPWHQDQSGGYASLCRSGSQGTVRPPIKSRLAVGCRAESAQQSRPSFKLAFNFIKIKRAKKKEKQNKKMWDLQELC
ncbi:hypothetical protein O0I10_006693 [Lichtheimia ornata]|uniref:Uncharacterized protein n=1 Tax=Lichtheimia ornata TaxID=688661 RepID=A0AAD7V207_9FUNG|nr:uncharacterized protein O0I10_006693 [Lichtheimia ornata]KAJ8657627.1 hypothetical protein O0I10_006693 [Lichtheimia ornata]